MQNIQGRQRVIIEHLSPQVENGQFPAKRSLGEDVEVQADIFADGHDIVKGVLLYKHSNDKNMQKIPMQYIVNDRWKATFTPETTGFYEYTVLAFVDHFASWQYGLRKKYEAQQDIKVELLIGAEMLEKVAGRTHGEVADRLKGWAESIRRHDHQDFIDQAVQLSLNDEVTDLMYQHYDLTDATTYPTNFTVEVERKKALFSTWYELFPRSAASEPGRHGNFHDVVRLLPEIAGMGFDVIYLPPIHPIGRSHRKGLNNALQANHGDPGSPWAIGSEEGGHKAIHAELGNMDDFQHLLREAENNGIEMALDIAFQCSPDHPYVKEHPQWFKWRPDGTVQYAENPPKKYQDILPINFENDDWQNLWEELKSVIQFWVDKGVKIFRVDNPHTKAFGFWQWAIGDIRSRNPEVIFLAEAFTRPRVMERLAKAGFNQSYTYFTWRNNPWEMREYMQELTSSPLRDYFRPNFWPNTPDILPPVLVHGGEPAFIMRLILAATLSSNYGLYGPVYEFGINTPFPGKEEYLDSEKYEVKHWDWHKETRIKEIITRINKIRKENPALQDTFNIHFADSSNPNILCFGKYDPKSKNKIIVAVNMDPYNTQGASVRIPVEQIGINPHAPYEVYDMMSYSRYTWHGEWNYVEMNPYQMPAHVFRVEQ
ncbi:alpha-1,4-glucan--maltose-1-phosphate maltosyltransferase [Catalinimonas niigatensis]|uniref:alpha-1,4-glucan--maltose-1-phosphate maltosyltransferase n=1 Tax=Catalinimonas niigatensis TaxID=1397264 RepID=UPI002664EA35|nr:alpha-1,4-glucan--maltose-1-phosphate maltosyltransferase [Catalinimonas niigatensis]WPP50882.1 alpha-1,4-glucan--maltose-1-phosphate maltosyltransferase [Catalinimonas niigatensis]